METYYIINYSCSLDYFEDTSLYRWVPEVILIHFNTLIDIYLTLDYEFSKEKFLLKLSAFKQ